MSGWSLPTPAPLPSTVPVDQGKRALFGYDILFKQGAMPLTAGGDYVRIGGEDNLRAAIYRRLITRPNEFRFRPNYGAGVQSFVKKVQSQANLDACKQRIQDQLSQDRRIQSVAVEIASVAINGKAALKIFIKVTANGKLHAFEPFTFQQEATA